MNKHFAILPDGTRATRNSQNRIYTHCVAVRVSYENALNWAKTFSPSAESNYKYAVREANPATRRWEHTEEVIAAYAETAAMTLEEYKAHTIAKAVAAVEKEKAAGYYDKWGVLGWNGRLDLAQKLASGAGSRPYYAEAKIIEAVLL